jgi:hypothetical protein
MYSKFGVKSGKIENDEELAGELEGKSALGRKR